MIGPSKVRGCLFDMNGILVDDEHLHEEAFRSALKPIGLALTSEDYMRYFIGKLTGEDWRSIVELRRAGTTSS